MVDKEGENRNKTKEDFDLNYELSTLVTKGILPQRIANKLEEKLKEKKVKIKKEQFDILITKIKNIMRTYSKFDQIPKSDITAKSTQIDQIKSNEDMLKILENIEKLQDRINTLERGIQKNSSSIKREYLDKKPLKTSYVTTQDIKMPEGVTEYDQKVDLDPLTEIPTDPESVIVLMKWLQYLIDKCGHANLPNILDYYVDIGWISVDAKIGLIEYSQGITEENKKTEPQKRDLNNLHSRDHIQSLIFIQKLKGRIFDKYFIDRIEGEISRITKKIDNYQFK